MLTPKRVLEATPILFELKQLQSAINPNTFTAQEAGIYCNADITKSGNRALITKHYDTTLNLFAEAFLYELLASSEQLKPKFYSSPNGNWFNPFNVIGVSLHKELSNNAPLFAPDWFVDAFNAIFGFPCYIPPPKLNLFSHFSVCRKCFSISPEFL